MSSNKANKPLLSYTIDDFCEATGTTRSNVYKEIAKGRLASFKLGRRRMISVRAAQEFIATLEADSKAAA
jgi:excisionase family DNA binding protein